MVTTTHDPAGGGRPRLIFALGGSVLVEAGEPVMQQEFNLVRGVTVVGSAPSSTLQLSGVDGHQADILRDEFDEYVFVQYSAELPSHINGQLVESSPLRTGDRIEIGPWTMTYFREEYADHGRPYGGRQGGEGATQAAQPPRSETTPAEEPAPADLQTRPVGEAS
jgi:hypothetical protein